MNKIYALIDPIDKEIKYVGQTSLTLYRRLTRHVSEALTKKEQTQKRKWIKNLIDMELSPIIELLEITEFPNEREKYWTDKYKNTIFNEVFIKYQKPNSKKVYAMCLEPGSIIEFDNIKEASIKTKTNNKNIVKAIHANKNANNYLWSYNKNFNMDYKNKPTWIILTDIKNNSKILFKTKTDAILYTNGNFKSHKNGAEYALKHKNKEYRGYYWDYAKEHVKSCELLETPEEGNQQPSSNGDIEKGSTTSGESHVDNKSTKSAGQSVKHYLLETKSLFNRVY